MSLELLFSELKSNGVRLTQARKAVIEVLSDASEPRSAPELQRSLQARGLLVNKTTVYRDLTFLIKAGVVSELDFGEGKKRFELAGEHHHHLICRSCKIVAELVLPIHLEREEAAIFDTTNFKVTDHMLEFFGVCQRCQVQGVL